MIIKYFEIENNYGDLIKGNIHFPEMNHKVPLVIFSHGFKGFSNWSFIPYITEKFAEYGFISVNFDFSLNGIIDSEKQIYDDSIFRRSKVSVAVDDLSKLIELVNNGSLFPEFLQEKFSGEIYLAGHSLGGAISILTAPRFENIKKISLWASISRLDRNTHRQKEIWKNRGFTDVEIATTGQKLHLDYSYIEDKDTNFPNNAIMDNLSSLNYPVQIIHPENDMTVNIREAYELQSTQSDIRKRDLIVIEKCGHTFNCRHPFAEPSPAIEKAFQQARLFFE